MKIVLCNEEIGTEMGNEEKFAMFSVVTFQRTQARKGVK